MGQHVKHSDSPQILSTGGKRVAKRQAGPAEERVRGALSKTAALWSTMTLPSLKEEKSRQDAEKPAESPGEKPVPARPQAAAPKQQPPARPQAAAPKQQASAPRQQSPARPQAAAPKQQASAPRQQSPARPRTAAPKQQASAPRQQPPARPQAAAPKQQASAPRQQPPAKPRTAAPKQQASAPRQQPPAKPQTAAPKQQASAPRHQSPARPQTAASKQQAAPAAAALADPPVKAPSGAEGKSENILAEKAAAFYQKARGLFARGRASAARLGASAANGGVMKRLRRVRRRWHHVVREERAKRFPESDRAIVQLILFAWNMPPMAMSLLREKMLGRRKQAVHRTGRFLARFEHKKVRPAPFFAAGGALALLILAFSLYTYGTTVSYDGKVIAAVDSRAVAENARSDLEKITARTLGTQYTIDESLLQYSSRFLPRSEVVSADALEEDLSQQIGLVTYGYSLYVDGGLIGSTPYQGALDELLHQLQLGMMDADTISCDFAEDVQIRPGYVPTEQIMNLGYLAETLYSTKTAEVNYEVKKGDTWSEIAEDHGLSTKELLALNPGYDINKLAIGEVLTLSASVPYLTMTVVKQEHYLEDLMYDIENTDSADIWKGDYKVTSKGAYGAADTVANVTYVNGEETDRTVLSSVTLKNPVTEQRLLGTKERPTWLPTGTFRWPVSGRITSTFGGRRSPGGIGSTNHKGIDIANRYGTAVCAADGGTVVYAGWMSGYGYLVQVDHGNGYVTYYGHNSSLTTSVGAHVYKGQQIARMGSTGNSTGNHCHFEVRYNGVARNPLNYLP